MWFGEIDKLESALCFTTALRISLAFPYPLTNCLPAIRVAKNDFGEQVVTTQVELPLLDNEGGECATAALDTQAPDKETDRLRSMQIMAYIASASCVKAVSKSSPMAKVK